MTDETKRYWFSAKRYGWGWGPPSTWQGWAVLAAWFAITVPGTVWLATYGRLLLFVFVVVMSAILIAVAYATGEPPSWRGPLPRYIVFLLSSLIAIAIVMLGVALYILEK